MKERKLLRPWKLEHSIGATFALLMFVLIVLDSHCVDDSQGLVIYEPTNGTRSGEAIACDYDFLTEHAIMESVKETIEKIAMPEPDRITLLSERIDNYQKRLFKLQERVEVLEKEIKTFGRVREDYGISVVFTCAVLGCDHTTCKLGRSIK